MKRTAKTNGPYIGLALAKANEFLFLCKLNFDDVVEISNEPKLAVSGGPVSDEIIHFNKKIPDNFDIKGYKAD